jgi:phosphoglycolate phosphatase-like HAD superfamily hydrolase
MTAYEAIVYDLDGTLVRLNVDWDRAHETVVGRLRPHGLDVADENLWEILDLANDHGVRGVVEEALAEHERAGAKTADRLATADDLPLGVPVAVCSLNCEAACRIALDRHGLSGYVDAVVGRDTVATRKPDPEPLLRAVEMLGVDPGAALFVGDSPRDREAADRAGVAFEYVSDRES